MERTLEQLKDDVEQLKKHIKLLEEIIELKKKVQRLETEANSFYPIHPDFTTVRCHDC